MNSLLVVFAILYFCQQENLTSAVELKPDIDTGDVCSLPKQVGPCKAAMKRWYFNWASKSCKEFIYGGCQGNGNNFMTLKGCQKTCPVCTLPPKSGPCLALFYRYYFDVKKGKCQQFIYGGCQPNANNFNTIQECQKRCERDYA